MYMFRSILERIPKNRLEMVNDLEIPEVPASTYLPSDPVSIDSDSLTSGSDDEALTASSESSLALSRAMTDSEIDYGRHRRLRSRSFVNPWVQMAAALDAFPSYYLDSLNSFIDTSSESTEVQKCTFEAHRFNDELRLKMQRFFDDECCAFEPDDPSLLELKEALECLEMKDLEFENIFP